MSKKSTDIIEAPSTALGAPQSFGEHAGAGSDDFDDASLVMPTLKVLQDMSDEVKPRHEKYIDGAVSGMFHLNVGSELFEEVLFVPAYVQRVYCEFKPNRGPLVGMHLPEDPIVAAARKVANGEPHKMVTPEGNRLVESFRNFIVTLDPETYEPVDAAMFPISSMKIKQYKTFMSGMWKFQQKWGKSHGEIPPVYAFVLRCTTWLDHKDEDEFYNTTFSYALPEGAQASMVGPGHPAFERAAKLRQIVETGGYKVQEVHEQAEVEPVEEDDIPF